MQLNAKKKKKSKNGQRTEGLNRHFSEEDTKMAKQHMKRCSTPPLIRKMQIETTVRCHPTGQNGYHQKIHKQQMLERVWREGNPPTL